jgi:imidazolonepropionase-like amidohydrolase
LKGIRTMKHLKLLVFIPIVFLCCISLSAQSIAIVGGNIVTGTGETIDGGTILVKNQRIEKVGREIEIPEGCKVIDASGKTIWPGRIDALSIIGLSEIGAVAVTNDANEKTSTNTAHLRAADGINPESSVVGVTRNNGITTTQVMQGRAAPINGLTAIIDLDGRRLDQMIVTDGSAIVLNLNAMERGKYPSTRPGVMAFIRQSFFDIQNKLDKADDKAKPSLKEQTLAQVLKGEISVIAFCDANQDIRNAITLGNEFSLDMILVPGRGWSRQIEMIKESGYPVLVTGTFTNPGENQTYDHNYRMAGELHKAGIPLAFASCTAHNARQMPDAVSMSVTYGLPYETGMQALTLSAARILGIEKDYGSIEAGKIANIAVWNGDPLQISSRVVNLIIRGKEVSLQSRQELLRDRYKEIDD